MRRPTSLKARTSKRVNFSSRWIAARMKPRSSRLRRAWENQGSRLGVYSALVGVATMIGSFVSGYVSFYFGYFATFVLAAIFLAGSTILVPKI